MKNIIKLLALSFFIFNISSCDCNDSHEEEARGFYKDTSLMYLWGSVDTVLSRYYNFCKNGDLCFSEEYKTINENYSCHEVWYVEDSIIYRVGGGETICTYRKGIVGKYKINNDTLFLISRTGNGDEYIKEPIKYVKVSKHP